MTFSPKLAAIATAVLALCLHGMAAAWPAGTPCEFGYDGKWCRAVSRGLVGDLPQAAARGFVGEVLELSEVRARGVSTLVPLDDVASHVVAKGTHLLWTDADERKLELEQKKLLSQGEPSRSKKKAAKQPVAPQKQSASEKKAASKPAASKPAAAPKQQAARRSKKLRLVELGDDELHSVLQFAGPLGLGGAALACKRLLALVKSLSTEAKGTFDRWALAAACAGMAWNSLDRCMPISGDDRSFIALCEKTGRLRRCNTSVMLRKLPRKAHRGHPGDDVIGAWGRAYHCKATDPGAEGGHYLIPTIFGCIEGELVRGVIVVHAYLADHRAACNKAVGDIRQFTLLKGSDSFERMRDSLDCSGRTLEARARFQNEIIRVTRPSRRSASIGLPLSPSNFLWGIDYAAGLCPLLLASMADPNLPCLAELQTLTLKCFRLIATNNGFRAPAFAAMGPTVWPAREVLRLICKAAGARLEEFEQLPLDINRVSCVQIKPRPLRWLSASDLDGLKSHALWGSGDAAGLEQLWDQLEEADGLEEAEALLLQIVRLKARHLASA